MDTRKIQHTFKTDSNPNSLKHTEIEIEKANAEKAKAIKEALAKDQDFKSRTKLNMASMTIDLSSNPADDESEKNEALITAYKKTLADEQQKSDIARPGFRK